MSDFLPISASLDSVFGSESAQRISSAAARFSASIGASESPVSRRADEVELSDHALFLARLREEPEVRTEIVDRARQNIERGAYDTDAVIDGAIDRLAQDLDLEA